MFEEDIVRRSTVENRLRDSTITAEYVSTVLKRGAERSPHSLRVGYVEEEGTLQGNPAEGIGL